MTAPLDDRDMAILRALSLNPVSFVYFCDQLKRDYGIPTSRAQWRRLFMRLRRLEKEGYVTIGKRGRPRLAETVEIESLKLTPKGANTSK